MDYIEELDNRTLDNPFIMSEKLPEFEDIFPVLDVLMEKTEIALDDLLGVCSRRKLSSARSSVQDIYKRVSRCREDYQRIREDIQRVV